MFAALACKSWWLKIQCVWLKELEICLEFRDFKFLSIMNYEKQIAFSTLAISNLDKKGITLATGKISLWSLCALTILSYLLRNQTIYPRYLHGFVWLFRFKHISICSSFIWFIHKHNSVMRGPLQVKWDMAEIDRNQNHYTAQDKTICKGVPQIFGHMILLFVDVYCGQRFNIHTHVTVTEVLMISFMHDIYFDMLIV